MHKNPISIIRMHDAVKSFEPNLVKRKICAFAGKHKSGWLDHAESLLNLAFLYNSDSQLYIVKNEGPEQPWCRCIYASAPELIRIFIICL